MVKWRPKGREISIFRHFPRHPNTLIIQTFFGCNHLIYNTLNLYQWGMNQINGNIRDENHGHMLDIRISNQNSKGFNNTSTESFPWGTKRFFDR